MLESDQYIVVQQVYDMDRAILAADRHDVDDWTLDHCLDRAGQRELIDFLLLYDIPQLHFCASIEKHLVHVSDRMNEAVQFSIVKLLALDNFCGLSIEYQKLSLLSQGED